MNPQKVLEMNYIVIKVEKSMESLDSILDVVEELMNFKINLKKLPRM